MRIALLVVLAFAGLWFAALRPKPADIAPPAPTPAPASANKATDAKPGKAADAAPAKPAAAKASTDGAAAQPAAAEKPAAAKKPAGPEQPAALKRVLGDLEAKRTTVLLFWDRRVSDDREVRRAVGDIDRHGGKVRIHVQPISQVGLFEPVTRNVPVTTSPTVLIIGKDRRARAVQGITVTSELDELAVKALSGK